MDGAIAGDGHHVDHSRADARRSDTQQNRTRERWRDVVAEDVIVQGCGLNQDASRVCAEDIHRSGAGEHRRRRYRETHRGNRENARGWQALREVSSKPKLVVLIGVDSAADLQGAVGNGQRGNAHKTLSPELCKPAPIDCGPGRRSKTAAIVAIPQEVRAPVVETMAANRGQNDFSGPCRGQGGRWGGPALKQRLGTEEIVVEWKPTLPSCIDPT